MFKILLFLALIYFSVVIFFYTVFTYMDSLMRVTEPKQLPAKVIKFKGKKIRKRR